MFSVLRKYQIAAVAILSVVTISCDKNHDDDNRRNHQPPPPQQYGPGYQVGGYQNQPGHPGNQPGNQPGGRPGMNNGGRGNGLVRPRMKTVSVSAITNGISESTATVNLPEDAAFTVQTAQLEIAKSGVVTVAVKISENNVEKVLTLTGNFEKSQTTLNGESLQGTLTCSNESCTSAQVAITVTTASSPVEFDLEFSAK